MNTLEMQAKVAGWRQSIAAKTATLADMQEAVKQLRADRMSASGAAKRSAAKAAIPHADDLLAELEGL
jgi:hypothetical protein